jgi:5'-3' exonuclease
MGIKNFYTWFRNSEVFTDAVSVHQPPSNTDHILIDMNGIVHQAAQQIYKYGKYKSSAKQYSVQIPKRLQHLESGTENVSANIEKLEIDLFENVKTQVNNILKLVIPNNTVFLAVDGVAPKSKQNQQRQRRFRAAVERDSTTEDSFDSTCITAGTHFMQRLTDHICDPSWLKINPGVKYIFSSHNVPGEGEHKLIEWIKCNENTSDCFTVVGLDADLILLCACLNKKNVYILREREYKGYDWIDIDKARQTLENRNMKVSDILIWSCFLGNDFLPPIPSLEIRESPPIQGAFEWFFANYKNPLIVDNVLNFVEIKRLLTLHSSRECSIMSARFLEESKSYMKTREGNPVNRFPNTMWKGDIEVYRREYFATKLVRTYMASTRGTTEGGGDIECTVENVIRLYLQSVYWVYTYYTKSSKLDWNWFYPYNYTLHAADFAEHIDEKYDFRFDLSTKPCHHHDQLLRVVPPQSRDILPEFLRDRLDEINKDYVFEIDRAGKRFEWEAITIVNNVE